MKKGVTFSDLDGSKLRIGIVRARWNEQLTDPLVQSCLQALKDSGVQEQHITVINVPGSYELVHGAKSLIDGGAVDVVVAIGVLIKGETAHFEYIASAVSSGLMQLNTSTNVPVIFGVLTCLDEAQAVARSSGDNNHGYSWGQSAVEMGLLKQS